MFQHHKNAILCTAVTLTAIAVVAALVFLSSANVPEVNFQTTTSQDSLSIDNDHRPRLRVAVGAMISPSITKRYYEDLIKLIGDKVGKRTIFIQRKTYAEVNTLIENREIDLAFVCSGPYVKGHDKFGLELLAVPVVAGRNVYHSYIISNVDGHLRSLDDLRGTRFAFTDPDSNTGCLVPKYMLAKRNETPDSFFKETFFTYSHDNAIKAVSDKLADGAAVDSLIWEFMKATTPAAVEKTVVIEKSPPYGIPPVVVHPDLDPGLKAELKAALLSLHEDFRAKKLIDQVHIDRFEAADDALYETVREMQTWQNEGN